MLTLLWIILATLAGGLLSLLAAALLAYTLLERWASRMVSFAVGVLLAAAFLSLLPEAVAAGLSIEQTFAGVLCGILLFFVLEKLALWRHEHPHHHTAGTPHTKPAGMMLLLGDGVHNFVDGILIAAAFLQDPALGIATALAVIAHEIPQEIGDFMVLLDAGYSKRRALLLNGLCSLSAVAGGVLGYLLLEQSREIIPYALVLAAASFIYIAIADLVPDLHRTHKIRAAPAQFALILLGIGVVTAQHI